MECVYSPGTIGGIGYEVLLKALLQPQLGDTSFTIFGSQEEWEKTLNTLGLNPIYPVKIKDDLETAPEQIQTTPASQYFFQALKYVSESPLSRALVTGPMAKRDLPQSKTTHETWGHTELLSWFFQAHTTMMFCSEKVYMIPLTRHIPLSKVPLLLTPELIENTLSDLTHSETLFGKPLNKIRMALCGLNPHAGEQGLIGHEEKEWMTPMVEDLQSRGFNIKGPLSADTIMTPANLERFEVLLSCFHDQLLPAFKALYGSSSSQCTLGIPIVRTSVDHGTGEDIYLANKANPGSLICAILQARNFVQKKGSYAARS